MFWFLKNTIEYQKFHFLTKISVKTCLLNSHLQYYKIDLSFSIKLQEINLYVCEEYKKFSLEMLDIF